MTSAALNHHVACEVREFKSTLGDLELLLRVTNLRGRSLVFTCDAVQIVNLRSRDVLRLRA